MKQEKYQAMYRLIKGWLSEVLSHVPLVLMALLALGSFVLFKQAPSSVIEAAPEVASTQNDYFLKRFLVTEFLPTGQTKSQVGGASAEHNPVSKALVVNQVEFAAQTKNGRYQGSAQSGKVSDDAKLVILQGRAVVDKAGTGTAPSVHFESEQITVRQDPDTVEASAPVRINNGKTQMAAESLRYEDASKETKLKGRVRMVIESK